MYLYNSEETYGTTITNTEYGPGPTLLAISSKSIEMLFITGLVGFMGYGDVWGLDS